MIPSIDALTTHLAKITALEQAAYVLMWDQATFMPSAGGHARGAQLAALKEAAHTLACAPQLGDMLEALSDREGTADAALVRVARRDYARATCVPGELVANIARHEVTSHQAWERAREANDFDPVADALTTTVALSRDYSACFPGADHLADPLIDAADPGQTVARLMPLFNTLRAGLVPLVQAVAERPAPDTAFLAGPYPQAPQLAFSRSAAARIGYDFSRGRLDLSSHPFTIAFSIDDVRITTRVREDDLTEALFSTLHEAGHGMYEQGVAVRHEGSPLAAGTSSGLHESQSRLWENMVGRSRSFWAYHYPLLQQTFPDQLGSVTQDAFYRGINRVCPSLIRTDADELTYNLHVMLRFDLECALLSGDLAVADLPDAWADRIQADLGVRPADHNNGVLQDIHWFAGLVGGAFQGYTLGNVCAAQLFASACEAHPEIVGQMAEGRFDTLKNWLTDKVYRYGRSLDADPVVEAACGVPVDSAPYLDYLQKKYTAIYDL